MKAARVIVENNSREVDSLYDYIIPTELLDKIKRGMRVYVPFGKGNRTLNAFITEIIDTNSGEFELKNIIDISDDEIYLRDEDFNLIDFLRENYNCTYFEAVKTILPRGLLSREKIYIKGNNKNIDELPLRLKAFLKLLDEKWQELDELNKKCIIKRYELFSLRDKDFIDIRIDMKQDVNIRYEKFYCAENNDLVNNFLKGEDKRLKNQRRLLCEILKGGPSTFKEINEKYEGSRAVLKALIDKGLLKELLRESLRNPEPNEYKYERVKLFDYQREAVETILNSEKNGKYINLIYGVTGSGKTEIYLTMVEEMINRGCSSIVLVPEISLTPQTVERFKGRFGNLIAVIHSALSEGERYDEWRRIKNGDVLVVVGARSAVFSPLKNLKLIIIDEEHEYSYKSDSTPKYNTKDVAAFRIKNEGILILGSATPSVESYFQGKEGNYNLIEIEKRIENKSLPSVSIVDMREELKKGNRTIFSRELYEGISENIKRKEQTIIFLNRRGYSTYISCRACGHVLKCDSCDATLTYHVNTSKLICHYCGREFTVPIICPNCGSKYIKYFGTGTEKVEMEIKKFFPESRILRMDFDTTRKKGDYGRIYRAFKRQEADILVGTQMVSKGLDFKNVTLVGVIAADVSLNIPDFRAAERTFQLLTQVSGRAGRGEKSGRVIIQTYDPDHYSLYYAKNHDYKGFYEREIALRKILNNPPYSDIMYILFAGKNEENVKNTSLLAAKKIGEIIKDAKILGPVPSHITKIKDNFRWHIIIKGDVKKYLKSVDDFMYYYIDKDDVKYSIDINPFNML